MYWLICVFYFTMDLFEHTSSIHSLVGKLILDWLPNDQVYIGYYEISQKISFPNFFGVKENFSVLFVLNVFNKPNIIWNFFFGCTE